MGIRWKAEEGCSIEPVASLHRVKSALIPADLSPILVRLGLTSETWFKLTTKFGKLFCRVAGKKESLPRVTPANIPHRFHAGHAALLGPPPNPSSLTGPAS